MNEWRQAFRSVWKNPGYALLSAATLGLGIGACVAMFGVADALVLRPLLLPDVDHVVLVGGLTADRFRLNTISPGDYFRWKSETATLDHLSVFGEDALNVSGPGAEPERILAGKSSADFFNALGVKPLVGRAFLPGEDEAGRSRVVILGEGLWASRYGRDPGVLGRSLEINGEAHQIIGVMGADVRVPAVAQLWIPYSFTAADRTRHRVFYLRAVARLKPGVSLQAANQELGAMAERLAREFPSTHARSSAGARLIREEITGPEMAGYTRLILGASLFLLLLACSNVANLHFARMSARAREFALRTALGAGRGRLVRGLIAEGLVLGVLGGIAGLFAGAWGLDLVRAGMPAEVEVSIPGWKRVGINPHVLGYAVLLVAASGIASGLASAFSGFLSRPFDVLKESGRNAAGGRGRSRIRAALVVVQMLLAMMLLAGAGLTVRGFQKVASPEVGVDPARVLTMRVFLPESQYREEAQVNAFQRDLLRRMAETPGITGAALSTGLPYADTGGLMVYALEGRPEPANAFSQLARTNHVSPGYFDVAGVGLRRGRRFDVRDGREAPHVALVNQAFADRFYPGEDAIGRRILGVGPAAAAYPWLTIVGITANVRSGPEEMIVRPEVYRPLDQTVNRSVMVLARTAGDPLALGPVVRGHVQALDRSLPVDRVATYAKLISYRLVGFGYVAWLMGVFGALALVLSAVGIYSVIAFFVAERSHEIGIRMALGAASGNVLAQVLGQGMRMAAVGLAIGLAGALAIARLLNNLLFGVSGTDFVSLGSVALLLLTAAVLACVIPARRAARVDPMTALRHD